jgi:hypothetical protein
MPGRFSLNWSLDGLGNHSVRQVLRVSAAGPQVRIRLSNLDGTKPLRATNGTVVAFGDSIADGYGPIPCVNRRYPDRLAERLVAAGRPLGGGPSPSSVTSVRRGGR